VTVVAVDKAKDKPTTANSADGEVMLDIEVAGAVAPGAAIAVYFAPNTDRGFLDAVTTAIHDAVNKPSVISISWGGAEVTWTQQAMTAFEQVFTDAAAMGVTICVAAGDNGSTDGQTNGTQNVDFPASAPHALACGGTSLVVNAAGVATETVWNDGPNSATGGGYSSFFPVPAYQSTLGFTSGRGVPDVAGDADPDTGYDIRVDGQDLVIGGTSAVAPLWAGLIALLNQQLGHPIGFLNPLLYGSLQSKGVTNDITKGNNGAQQAGKGWDACTGWGTPNGQALLRALGS
jgi:kumamolisin